MKEENPNIEELLNSYIDGELTERHRAEVEQMISHDAQLAERLRELQKCKMLVSSLPRAEAPGEMLEQIKSSVASKALLGQQPERFYERKGARHLLVRKVLTAAAMIGLVAVLAGVVYTIVAPESVPVAAGFTGRLELKTTNLLAVDAAIENAIEHNGISKLTGSGRQGGKNVYVLSSSREAMSLLLSDLKNVWGSFDSATLFVKTKTSGERVVDNVSTEQIADLIIPVMPDITGPAEPIEKPATPLKDKKKVHLTIVLAGGE